MVKRIISCIICLIMTLGCVLTATATDIDSIKEQQAALEQQSAEYQAVFSDNSENEIDNMEEKENESID